MNKVRCGPKNLDVVRTFRRSASHSRAANSSCGRFAKTSFCRFSPKSVFERTVSPTIGNALRNNAAFSNRCTTATPKAMPPVT